VPRQRFTGTGLKSVSRQVPLELGAYYAMLTDDGLD
jgi:hypothetical protein